MRKGAGLPHVRFHDLRHTAASEMLRRGLLLREVQYVLDRFADTGASRRLGFR